MSLPKTEVELIHDVALFHDSSLTNQNELKTVRFHQGTGMVNLVNFREGAVGFAWNRRFEREYAKLSD